MFLVRDIVNQDCCTAVVINKHCACFHDLRVFEDFSRNPRQHIKFGYHCPEHCPLKCGELWSTLFLKLAFKFCPVCPRFVVYFGSLFLYSPSLTIDLSCNLCFISWTLKITRVVLSLHLCPPLFSFSPSSHYFWPISYVFCFIVSFQSLPNFPLAPCTVEIFLESHMTYFCIN